MVPPKRKICVLVSGGLDSAVLTKWCLQRYDYVQPVYVEASLRWEKAELYWLKRWLKKMASPRLKPLICLKVPVNLMYGAHWSLGKGKTPKADAPWEAVYLPGRNLLLLSLAGTLSARLGVGNIAIGTLLGNPFADATPAFFKTMEKIFKRLFGPIRIQAPLKRHDKVRVVKLGKGVPLDLTFSCIDPRGIKPCGDCSKCFERCQGLASP